MGVIWAGSPEMPIARMPGATRPLARYDFSQSGSEYFETQSQQRAESAQRWNELLASLHAVVRASGEQSWCLKPAVVDKSYSEGV